MTKWRIVIGIFIVSVLVVAGYWGYMTYLAPLPPTPTPQAAMETVSPLPAVVSAEGKVVPAAHVSLSFGVPGRVERVFVHRGDRVQQGDILVRLEDVEQVQATLAAAELERISAQQALDELYDKHDLTLAQARQGVSEAKKAVDDAQRYLDNLNAPPNDADVEAAEAALTLAEKLLKEAQKNYNKYAHKAESNPKRAAARLALALAQKQYDFAVRYYNYLTGTPSDLTIEQAEANLALAQAQLDEAEKQYQTLLDGPDPDDVALAQARLANARASLAAAQAALEKLELRAPISGVVVTLDAKEGEYVTPGLPLVVIADTSTWQVETTDLAESDVALLGEGMEATVTLDAFPDESFRGRIVEIGLLGEDRRGAVTYRVVLDFDPRDLPVRWGMTAFVDIELP